MLLGRARRGASGALYPQSATAGLNAHLRSQPTEFCPSHPALKTGSRAAQACEPRQIRKKATVNSHHGCYEVARSELDSWDVAGRLNREWGTTFF